MVLIFFMLFCLVMFLLIIVQMCVKKTISKYNHIFVTEISVFFFVWGGQCVEIQVYSIILL